MATGRGTENRLQHHPIVCDFQSECDGKIAGHSGLGANLREQLGPGFGQRFGLHFKHAHQPWTMERVIDLFFEYSKRVYYFSRLSSCNYLGDGLASVRNELRLGVLNGKPAVSGAGAGNSGSSAASGKRGKSKKMS